MKGVVLVGSVNVMLMLNGVLSGLGCLYSRIVGLALHNPRVGYSRPMAETGQKC